MSGPTNSGFRRWVTSDGEGFLPDAIRQHLASPDDLVAAIAQSGAYTDAQVAAVKQILVPIVVSDTPPTGPRVGDLWVDTN